MLIDDRLRVWTLRRFDWLIAATVGSVGGGLAGETVVGWLRTTCTTVAVVYQGCQPNGPTTPLHVLIVAAGVVCGAATGASVYGLFRLP